MGAIPFIIITIVYAMSMISELEDNVKKDGLLRNSIVSEHVKELVGINFHSLHTMALNPMIIQYVSTPSQEQHEVIYELLKETNDTFKDTNMLALTAADANQLIRTDDSELVNLSKRRHFQEAMKGNDFVSDIILSMSTGKMIVVLEVPIKNEEGTPIGMLQRNFDLSALQDFVETLDDSQNSVLIVDREGKMIANSDINEHVDENNYKFILDKIDNDSGLLRLDIDGQDSLVSYSKNTLTGWTIITVQPYHFILDQVYNTIIKALIIGAFMLLIVSITAYLLSIRATKPIIDITNAADKIVSGNASVDELKISSEDELGQMAAAFNKIRSARDAYQLESELDKLTKLYNKTTMEKLCKMKLDEFDSQDGSLTALFIIDLDHFKEVNDTMGHQFGDKVLMEFAKAIRKRFRPNDCIGRFGGDEFVIVIDHLPGEDIIIRKAESIIQAARELMIDGQNANVTASIGIAIVPQHGRDYESLFKAADLALYHVKANGRNGYYYETKDR